MISRARLVRSSFSLGVNRISPLTQTTDIPGCDPGDAHLFTPKCDGNDAGIRRFVAFQKAALAGVPVFAVRDSRAQLAWADYEKMGKEVLP